MSNSLGGITNADIRHSIGNRCFNAGGLVIDETNTENCKIQAAIEHTVNGVFQTDYAIAAEIDLSALAVLSAKDGTIGAAGSAIDMPALAAGADSVTKVWLLACKGNEAWIVEPEIANAASGEYGDYSLSCPPGYAVFGAIKVVQAAGAAAFVLGTTALTGVANQTVSFFDIATCPATVADLATV